MFRTFTLLLVFLAIPVVINQSKGSQNTAPSQQVAAEQQSCNENSNQMGGMELKECYAALYSGADKRLNTIYKQILEMMNDKLAEAKSIADLGEIKYAQTAINKLKEAERTGFNTAIFTAAQQYNNMKAAL